MIQHLCKEGSRGFVGCRVARMVLVGCLAMCSLWVMPSVSMAQIPAAAKSADQGAMSQYQDTIKKYIADQLALVAGKDPVAQEKARDQLINEVAARNANPGVAFLYAYSTELNDQVVAILPTCDIRARINMGVLVTGVAEVAKNVRLDGATQVLLDDSSVSVRIWGMKAAESVLPALLRNPMTMDNPSLIAAIGKAAKKTPAGDVGAGALYHAAYESLGLGITNVGGTGAAADSASLVQTVPMVLDLFKARVQAMRDKGTIDNVAVDAKYGTFFLTHSSVWGLLTPEQQTQTVQAMSDMISLVAQQAARSNKETADMLWPYIRETAKQFWVIGGNVGAKELQDAVDQASNVNDRTSGDEFMNAIQGIYSALKAVPRFAMLTAPPTLPATTGGA